MHLVFEWLKLLAFICAFYVVLFGLSHWTIYDHALEIHRDRITVQMVGEIRNADPSIPRPRREELAREYAGCIQELVRANVNSTDALLQLLSFGWLGNKLFVTEEQAAACSAETGIA